MTFYTPITARTAGLHARYEMVQELFLCTIVMNEGRVVADGLTMEIFENEELLMVQGRLEKP